MSVNSELRDRAIRHALAIGRYSRQTSDDIVRLLNSADQDISDQIAKRLAGIEDRGIGLSKRTMARLDALVAEIRAINSEVYGRTYDQLADDLVAFGTAEAEFQRDTITKSLPGDIGNLGMTLPSPIVLKAIVEARPIMGTLLEKQFTTMSAVRTDAIDAAIRMGMVAGESTDDIVRRIRGTKAGGYNDGALGVSRRSLQTRVRTAVTHVSNQASQETWKANSRVVDAWQFLATLDNRTTVICGSLDGQTFPIGEGPIPPLHLNCRSITVAVTKSWRDLGIDADQLDAPARSSMDGLVAGGTTFESWLRGKDEATQNKVMGKTKADLWRSKKLDLKDFVKNGQTPLTLKQLKAAHADILG